MFGSGESSIMSEHKTKDCAGWRPYSTLTFALFSAPSKFAEFLDHSPYELFTLRLDGTLTLSLIDT